MTPVRVGLVGAGSWAGRMHAPMLAAGPHTVLVGVWRRRADATARLAHCHRATAYARLEEMVAACDAVSFAVSPAEQPELAATAARMGRPLLLEKPMASDLAGARRLVEVIDEAGVATQLVLTLRYANAIREFLAAATALDADGGHAQWISGAALGRDARLWRREVGALLDVGPHVLDLLDAALGRIRGVRQLWPQEQVLCAKAAEGGLLDLRSRCEAEDDPARGREWGPGTRHQLRHPSLVR